MNISVVTPFDSSNFGAFLQAWCLKKILEERGHTVSHKLTRSEDYVRNLYFRQNKRRFLQARRNDPAEREFNEEKYRIFREAQKSFSTEQVGEEDVCILGSDEIWNVRKQVFRNPVFWGEGSSKVIAYAPSIGNAKAEDLEKWPAAINGLKKLTSIMVRDERTSQAVKTITGTSPEIVCDPTMLPDVSSWGDEIRDAYLEENSCLLIYAYKLRRNEIRAIRIWAKGHNMKTVACCFYHPWCDHQINCSPLQFSSLIRQCGAVYSGTFHGTVFSVLNHKNVIVSTKNEKTVQFLMGLDLENVLIEPEKVRAELIEKKSNDSGIDWARIDGLIAQFREKSLRALEEALETAGEGKAKFDYSICTYDLCTACGACQNACAMDAITMRADGYGSIHPFIDEQKCVHCDKCRKVCPVNHPAKKREPGICLAAQRKDKEQSILSASGGIGSLLMEKMFSGGGSVYGAVMEEDGYTHHVKAADLDTIFRMRRSKYVHSETENVFQSVRNDIRDNKQVLFVGTPCQVAGLINFLGGRKENLLTVDLVCHGTPDYQYLHEHLKKIGKGKTISNVTFRGDEKDFELKAYCRNKMIYCRSRTKDRYYKAFMERMTYRESCYKCPYACPERVGDITIGDFWKINRSSLKTIEEGRISLVLINSDKGNNFFASIKEQCSWEERDYQEARAGNPNLNQPSRRSAYRDRFLRHYSSGRSFDDAFIRSGIIKKYLLDCCKDTAVWKKTRKAIKRWRNP